MIEKYFNFFVPGRKKYYISNLCKKNLINLQNIFFIDVTCPIYFRSNFINTNDKLKELYHIKINEMLLLQDKNLPSSKWNLTRVVDVHPGSDGVLRIVTIRTANRLRRRDVSKLYALPQ